MTHLGSNETTTLVASGVMGVGLAYPIAYLFQYLKRNPVTSNTNSTTYEQEIATALLPMKPEGSGKVRISMSGELVDLLAENPTNEQIEQGQEVLIVKMKDGTANCQSKFNNRQHKINNQNIHTKEKLNGD